MVSRKKLKKKLLPVKSWDLNKLELKLRSKSDQKKTQKTKSEISLQDSYRTRRNLYLHILRQIQAYFPVQDKELSKYRSVFQKSTSGSWKPSHRDRLMSQIEQARIVYLADFHALQQSQKSQLRILRSLTGDGKKRILAVECISHKDQSKLDQYLSGHLSEKDFLKNIEWKKNWGFSWQHYKPIFRWAQKNSVRLIGLNVGSRHLVKLKDRDSFAANILDRELSRLPDHQLIVIYGEWHLCPEHLPLQVRRLTKAKHKTVTVLQNDDASYFQLLKKQLSDHVDVLERSTDLFCVQSVPPWVKWQSYLIHLEADLGDKFFDEIDYTDEVQKFLKVIEADLRIQVDHSGLAVSTDRDSEVYKKISAHKDMKLQKWLKLLIENEVSFYSPELSLSYLARPTVNHCSALAMSYFGSRISKRKTSLYDQPQMFLRLVWLETLNYFGSKVVNPKRKTDTIQDIKNSLVANQPKDRGRQALRIALAQKMRESLILLGQTKSFHMPKLQNVSHYREAARILGGMLGEKMYTGFRQGRFHADILHKWLKQSYESDNFESFYYSVIEILESLPDSFNSKLDRL